MSDRRTPSEAESHAFVQKIIAFRAGLPPNEQQMLDDLVDVVSTAQATEDVGTYWFTTPTIGPNPTVGPNYATNTDVWAPYRNSATYSGMRAGGY
jgi:hypothetical protein